MNQEYLKTILNYDPETGIFSWAKRGKGIRAGKPVGSPDRDGYLYLTHLKSRYAMHRVAWLYVTGKWPVDQIDHKNRNRSDNRFENLRECSALENLRNRRFADRDVEPGVHPSGKKYRVRVWVDGRNQHFGTFEDPELAALVAKEARRIHHGEFAA